MSIKSYLQEKLITNKLGVEVSTVALGALTQYAIWKTPFTLFEGASKAVATVFTNGFWSSGEYLNEKNGWRKVFKTQSGVAWLFYETLNRYPSRSIGLQGDYRRITKIIQLPIGVSVAMISNEPDNSCHLFYKPSEGPVEKILEFLASEAKKKLTSKNFLLSCDMPMGKWPKLSLQDEKLHTIDSERTSRHIASFTKFIENGIHRSVLFTGMPGTGKTTLANTIVSKFDFTTLKVASNNRYLTNSPDAIYDIVRYFGVNAIIIDDFDQFVESAQFLGLLEWLNANCKLVIATVNSLANFHPAIVRPGRFDEVIEVNGLDREVIEPLLGDLANDYATKVAAWPVAYINELVKRAKFTEHNALQPMFDELDTRVKRQAEVLGQKKAA